MIALSHLAAAVLGAALGVAFGVAVLWLDRHIHRPWPPTGGQGRHTRG